MQYKYKFSSIIRELPVFLKLQHISLTHAFPIWLNLVWKYWKNLLHTSSVRYTAVYSPSPHNETFWFIWQMLMKMTSHFSLPIYFLFLIFLLDEQIREMENGMKWACEETAGPHIRLSNKELLGKLAENQDDNLKPRSMLNNYRHAIDRLSALMLGRFTHLLLEKKAVLFCWLWLPRGIQ